MPYTRRRPLSLSRYGRARGRGRHLLVRVDAAGPPRPRSYKILQPVDGRRRTGGWWKRRISGWCPAGWSRGGWVCGCCAWCASCPPPETGRPRGPRSPGRVTAQRGGATAGVSSMRLGNSQGVGERGRSQACMWNHWCCSASSGNTRSQGRASSVSTACPSPRRRHSSCVGSQIALMIACCVAMLVSRTNGLKPNSVIYLRRAWRGINGH